MVKVETQEEFLMRTRLYKSERENLDARLNELKKQRNVLTKEIAKISKQIAALCKENKRLNKERSNGIAHMVAIRKDKAAHTWFTVGVQEGENLRSCGFKYYQTKKECQPELEWFRYTYPERRFKITLVIRDAVNDSERRNKNGRNKVSGTD